MSVVYPRCYLAINGAMLPCIEATVNRKAKRASDTFSAEFAADVAAQFGMGLDFWADFKPMDAAVIMSSAIGGGDQRSMVTGKIDVPEIHWFENKISVASRDNSASLTESKRNKKYQNKKSSDIVADIANDHGLQPSTQSTGDNSGQMYDQDTTSLAINRSDWELMDDLADREGFRWYVDGNSLFFEPDDQSNGNFQVFFTPPTAGSYAVGNVTSLTTKRNMTAARPHQVTVKSWHHKDSKVYQSTQTLSGDGDPVIIEHHHNGRNQEQVQKLAKSRLKNATRHDLEVTIEMPGDLTCDVRQTLTLSGTGTIYDQDYDIDGVDFTIEWGKGFDMTISAKGAKQGRS